MILHSFVYLLTHRDYGPFEHDIKSQLFPARHPRRLNIAYPRGEIRSRLLPLADPAMLR
jgi:hypothetical protein